MNPGDRIRVQSNGSLYPGHVLAISRTGARAFVRFTTGSGRTRETWFRIARLTDWQAPDYVAPRQRRGSA